MKISQDLREFPRILEDFLGMCWGFPKNFFFLFFTVRLSVPVSCCSSFVLCGWSKKLCVLYSVFRLLDGKHICSLLVDLQFNEFVGIHQAAFQITDNQTSSDYFSEAAMYSKTPIFGHLFRTITSKSGHLPHSRYMEKPVSNLFNSSTPRKKVFRTCMLFSLLSLVTTYGKFAMTYTLLWVVLV